MWCWCTVNMIMHFIASAHTPTELSWRGMMDINGFAFGTGWNSKPLVAWCKTESWSKWCVYFPTYLTSAEEYPDDEYLDMSKSSSLEQNRKTLLFVICFHKIYVTKHWFICVFEFTCLCLRPPRASHLDSGLKRNSLYWALPTCVQRRQSEKQRSLKRKDRGGCHRIWQEGGGRGGEGTWNRKQEELSKTGWKMLKEEWGGPAGSITRKPQ